MRYLVLSIAGACIAAACGAAAQDELVPTWKLSPAGGAPRISAIVDLGAIGVPERGAVSRHDSDSAFVVGELVLIQGSDFGKQPTVTIGGQPAALLGRTASGAIVTRIPPSVSTGAVGVVIAHGAGKARRDIAVRRYAFALTGSVVHVVTMSASGTLAPAGTIAVPGARDLAVAGDGQAVYVAVAGAAPQLVVISTAKAGGPAVTLRVRLPSMDVQAVATAARAPLAAVLGAKSLVAFSLAEAQVPSRYEPVPLGTSASAHAVAVAAEGQHIAIASRDSNEIVIVDASAAPRFTVTPVVLLSQSRVPLVVDVAFSPRGDQLWVLAGDNKASLVGGQHATMLGSAPVTAPASEWRFAHVRTPHVPIAFAVATRENQLSATAIRSTAKRAAVVIAELPRESLMPGESAVGGRLLSADLDGGASPVWSETKHRLEALDVAISFDARYAVALAGTQEAGFAAYVTDLSGEPAHQLVLKGAGAAAGAARIALMP